jgi:hypothetical protein
MNRPFNLPVWVIVVLALVVRGKATYAISDVVNQVLYLRQLQAELPAGRNRIEGWLMQRVNRWIGEEIGSAESLVDAGVGAIGWLPNK